MTDDPHAPFLAAILARPEDDLPRLLYADWLDETAGGTERARCFGKGRFRRKYVMQPTGDSHTTGELPCPACHGTGEVGNGHAERAEFIRVQCELARMPPVSARRPGKDHLEKAARYDALRRRERALWIEHGRRLVSLPTCVDAWLVRLASTTERPPSGPGLALARRGFVESITCSWSDFRTHAAAIRKATPLRWVRLTGWPEQRYTIGMDDMMTWLKREYPGIEFKLPDGGTPVPAEVAEVIAQLAFQTPPSWRPLGMSAVPPRRDTGRLRR